MRILMGTLVMAALVAATVTAADTVTVEPFGKTVDGRSVEQYVLKSGDKYEARIMTLGATLRSFITPDKDGKLSDVLLGFDEVAPYGSDANQ